MARRTYRLGRRGELAEKTRRRIVEAISQLHSEQGIAETSMKQIAARADVSIGAVYHHFPTYDDAIVACARYTTDHLPLPGLEIFDGLTSTAERIERLVQEFFAYYERLPVLERVRCDADKFAPLKNFVDEQQRHLRDLVSAALETEIRDKATQQTIAALLDFAVYRALLGNGLTARQAAARITEIILVWLGTLATRAGRQSKKKKGL